MALSLPDRLFFASSLCNDKSPFDFFAIIIDVTNAYHWPGYSPAGDQGAWGLKLFVRFIGAVGEQHSLL